MIYNLAHNGNKLITFTIDGTTYQAINGMTWEEWFDSLYNTGLTTYDHCETCGEPLTINKEGRRGFGYYGRLSQYYYTVSPNLHVSGAPETFTTDILMKDVILEDGAVIKIKKDCSD